jgi:hypothetical protein
MEEELSHPERFITQILGSRLPKIGVLHTVLTFLFPFIAPLPFLDLKKDEMVYITKRNIVSFCKFYVRCYFWYYNATDSLHPIPQCPKTVWFTKRNRTQFCKFYSSCPSYSHILLASKYLWPERLYPDMPEGYEYTTFVSACQYLEVRGFKELRSFYASPVNSQFVERRENDEFWHALCFVEDWKLSWFLNYLEDDLGYEVLDW